MPATPKHSTDVNDTDRDNLNFGPIGVGDGRADPADDRPVLLAVLELSKETWLVGFTTPRGKGREVSVSGDHKAQKLMREIERARRKFGLPEAVRVISWYEAGRDGFWLHRFLRDRGVENLVIDSSSIEVNRRHRQAKTDKVDRDKLLNLLSRHYHGERGAVSLVRVPSAEAEDDRRFERHLECLKQEHKRLNNRILSALATEGVTATVSSDLMARLAESQTGDGRPFPRVLLQIVKQKLDALLLVERHMKSLRSERRARQKAALAQAEELAEAGQAEPDASRAPGKSGRRDDGGSASEAAHRGVLPGAGAGAWAWAWAADAGLDQPALIADQLMSLRGIGEESSWLLSKELFAWREIANRRELGAMVGLTPTPYSSGDSVREQGICRAGNKRVRTMMVEIAWLWLRHQPESALSRWFQDRFGHNGEKGQGKRLRKVGIVALARKLLVSLWRYLQTGEPPTGAELKGSPP